MDARQPGNLQPCPHPEDVLNIVKGYCADRDQSLEFGSFSPSLYDTAWLSLVPTKDDPQDLLFPQCLETIIRTQQADGTWPSYASSTDGILVSLAALLSVATHRSRSIPFSEEHQNFSQCIQKGVDGLESLLKSWAVDDAIHVGFELLVPALLRQLEKLAVHIRFPGQAKLTQVYLKKIGKFSPEVVYGPKQTTLLHSIEAFVDLIEYDRISHHCSETLGIFGSPAATAAYLVHSSTWDSRAERYLQKVVAAYGGGGAVPSAFPTPMFELSWTVSTMLSPVIKDSVSDVTQLGPTASLFEGIMRQQGSLAGFAPGILEDADDTARVLLTLIRLQRSDHSTNIDIAPMVATFESRECFKTYELERNSSFSANCNVVLTLLELDDRSTEQHASQIEKALVFLLSLTESGDRRIMDKWNISSEYPLMLLVEVFVLALRKYDAGCLVTVPEDIFKNQIPRSLCRIVSQILTSQRADGSWDGSLEVTSYGALTLAHALRLPWNPSLKEHLNGCITQAQDFLIAEYPRTKHLDYLWIEKTTFQSSLLRMAYCSMALHTTTPSEKWSDSVTDTFTSAIGQAPTIKKLFLRLPLLLKLHPQILELAVLEAKFHVRELTSRRNAILPRGDLPLSTDKYLEYIPVIWLLCNQVNSHALPASVMKDMLELSQLTFQVDEYMETTVAGLTQDQISLLEPWIRSQCRETTTSKHHPENGCCEQVANGDDHEHHLNGFENGDSHLPNGKDFSDSLAKIQIGLRKFIQYILHHEAVKCASPLIQNLLAIELSDFLLAHMHQNRDNARLKNLKRDGAHAGFSESESSYFTWARSIGADHTSCPFSFRFFTCLISQPSRLRKSFDSAQAQYFVSSVTRHLATMCRQYNDYGSIARDAQEDNLNSVDFAEFQASTWNADAVKAATNGDKPHGGEDKLSIDEHRNRARENLMAIAELERSLMEVSLKALAKAVPSSDIIAAVKVLIDVTDLFGQLYVAKDIASRKRGAEMMGA